MAAPGKVRQKLAAMLQAEFPMKGTLALTWKPERLHPATGAYRTNQSLDVWRWEGYGVHVRADGGELNVMLVGSYHTMSELVRAKNLALTANDEIVPAK